VAEAVLHNLPPDFESMGGIEIKNPTRSECSVLKASNLFEY